MSGPVLNSRNARVNEIAIALALSEFTSRTVVLHSDCPLISPAELLQHASIWSLSPEILTLVASKAVLASFYV